MDGTAATEHVHPRTKANILSIILYLYTFTTFKRAYTNKLNENNVYSPLESDMSKALGDRVERKWKRHLENRSKSNKAPSLHRVLCYTFWPELLCTGFLIGLSETIFLLCGPILLSQLLEYFTPDSKMPKSEAFFYAGMMLIVAGARILTYSQYEINCYQSSMKARVACWELIYRKVLKLSKSALRETSPGNIVNLISNDLTRFDQSSYLLHYIWVGPVNLICLTYMIYRAAGFAGLIGMSVTLIVILLQSYTAYISADYREQIAEKSDARIKLMDELISGIQVIKMYAWEKPFAKLVDQARKAEISIISKSSYLHGLFMTFSLVTAPATLFCAFITTFSLGYSITPTKVYVLVVIYNILNVTMSIMFVMGISSWVELSEAIKRVSNFLMNEEVTEIDELIVHNDKYGVTLEDVVVKWTNPEDRDPYENRRVSLKDGSSWVTEKTALINKDFCGEYMERNNYFGGDDIIANGLAPALGKKTLNEALSRISLCAKKGSLLSIIGPVGSGKSTLLQTILGELKITSGSLKISGSISYASQEPWIFSASIRQNILFGLDFYRMRYEEVIRVCSLEKDFEMFVGGDSAIVGERGASLSGGQKARINLARAVYRNADIYLLDDPLSAVDTHVAKDLYEQCINGFLAEKCRILVTHHMHYLPNSDNIILLINGKLEFEGSYDNLVTSSKKFAKLLHPEAEELPNKNIYTLDGMDGRVANKMKVTSKSKYEALPQIDKKKFILSTPNLYEPEEVEEEEGKSDGKVYERKARGSILFKYLLSGGNICTVTIILLLFIATQAVAGIVDYFLSYWSGVEELRRLIDEENDVYMLSTNTYLFIYGGLVILLFTVALTRSLVFYKLALWSSQKLHMNMFYNVIRANSRFFDTNTSGRIFNRFSSDMGAIDAQLPRVFVNSYQVLLTLIAALCIIIYVNPEFLIVIGVMAVLYCIVITIFLDVSKIIKRLERKCPILTHANASIQGLLTIRALKAENILRKEFNRYEDQHTGVCFMQLTVNAAFSLYIELISYMLLITVTLSFLTFGEFIGLQGSIVGLAITQAMSLTGVIQWGVRNAVETNNHLVSVERVLEYNSLPRETQPLIPECPLASWPEKGEIVFENVSVRYDTFLPLVLKNLNFVIKPREKVGVVGRTGAGKSSLIATLFRLAQIEGNIIIDGYNTRNLELEVIRSNISIIPQDPVLFSGSLRYNLDPFEQFEDNVLYSAINAVELNDPFHAVYTLDYKVMERGANFSVGQRQLICLARAIIRNNKILLLDEATANVDPQTDALIQQAIRKQFEKCTILTVAHRLNTVMDSDKVIVMDSGTIVEFDSPFNLLQNEKGVFSKMVANSGTAEQFRRMAFENYLERPV